jgi:hypothetical protein
MDSGSAATWWTTVRTPRTRRTATSSPWTRPTAPATSPSSSPTFLFRAVWRCISIKKLKVLIDPTVVPKGWWNKILKVLVNVNPEPEGLLDPKNQNLKFVGSDRKPYVSNFPILKSNLPLQGSVAVNLNKKQLKVLLDPTAVWRIISI